MSLYCAFDSGGTNPGPQPLSNTPDSLNQRLRKLLPRLRKFAYSLTLNLADADDLMQGTVERALVRDAPDHDDEALLRWMFRVCRNLWVDEIRARRVRGLTDPDPVDVDTQVGDGEHTLMGILEAGEVHQAMQQLGEEQRMVLELVAVEGYAYREAAELLDVPVGTVMSRLARARKQLAALLHGGNNSPP